MLQELEELPLFPLNTVLFPHATLRLHIFEERYREMIRLCVDQDRPFGVVLIRAGGEVGSIASPYLVGTVARIVSVDRYDDGRMDIQIQGESRFRVRHLDEDSHPYLLGYVEPLQEHAIEISEHNEQTLRSARAEFENWIQAVLSRQDFHVKVMLPPDPVVLSFTIANMLTIENLDKQKLLETTDTIDRMEELIPVLRAQAGEVTEPGYYRMDSTMLEDWISTN